jgi:hypothetical protein
MNQGKIGTQIVQKELKRGDGGIANSFQSNFIWSRDAVWQFQADSANYLVFRGL